MTEHKHEALIGSDNIIKCSTCGKVLDKIEQEIGKVVSAVGARRLLDEIAVAGGYMAIGFNEGFIVYSKNKDGVIEEVTASKRKEREFVIKKIIRNIG